MRCILFLILIKLLSTWFANLKLLLLLVLLLVMICKFFSVGPPFSLDYTYYIIVNTTSRSTSSLVRLLCLVIAAGLQLLKSRPSQLQDVFSG